MHNFARLGAHFALDKHFMFMLGCNSQRKDNIVTKQSKSSGQDQVTDLAQATTWQILRLLAKRHGYFLSVLLNAILLTYLLVRG